MKRLSASHVFLHFDPAATPAIRIAPGEELVVEVQDAFGGERDIARVPDPFTPAGRLGAGGRGWGRGQ